MAYTVGSASVEIVPDFRNAQLAITAFFAKQADEVKIPVRPDIDRNAVQAVEREARDAGDKVGKAISSGVTRNLSSGLTKGIEREIAKLEGDIEKARRTEKDATEGLKLAELRLKEARDKGNRSAATLLGLEQSVERQQIKIAESNRVVRESTDQLSQARRRLALATQQAAEDSAAKAAAAQKKADDAAVKAASRTAERIAAEQARAAAAHQRQIEVDARRELAAAERAADEKTRVYEQELRERVRQDERAARDEAKFARTAAQAYARAYNQAFKDAEKARIQVEIDEKQAREAGRSTGGIVTRSINHEIHQNAGLISGVLAGVFAVGAPAFIGAASTLFAGLGGLLVAQSEEVRSAWLGMFQQITANAEADAAVLIPTFQRMTTIIGQSFQRLRPQIRDAFEAAGPQVDTFSFALAQTAENALPGLVNAVKAAGPVVHGLATFMEEFGLGFSEFFDGLSDHAPAAGTAFAELGRTFHAILPALAELLGQGAELASVVLPVLTSGFSGLNIAVHALGGTLPVLGSAFLAFRSVQGVNRFINNMSLSLGKAAEAGGLFATAQGKASTALGAISKAAAPAAVAAGLVGLVMAASEQQINDWAQALNEGGTAARNARLEMQEFDQAIKPLTSGFTGFIGSLAPGGSALQLLADDTDEARQRNDEFLKSLTPLEAAQRDVEIASKELARGLADDSLSASDVAKLHSDLAEASARAAQEQENLEVATEGVTTAMGEQADAARALVDAQFGYEKATRKARDAQSDYNDAVKEFGKGSQQAKDALEEFNEALLKQVDAAAAVATSELPASMTDNQKAILGAKGSLDELNRLIAAGVDIPPEMEEYRQRLEQITGQADGAALAQAELSQAVGNLGFAVDSLPGTKQIQITAPTDELKAKLDDLGFTIVELPNGDIKVEANTQEAVNNLGNLTTLLNDVDTNHPEPKVSINDTAFQTTYKNLQANVRRLDGERPEPVVSMEDNPFQATWGPVMGQLTVVGRQRPQPVVSLRDLASTGISGIANKINQLHDREITITSVFRQIGSIPLLGGIGSGSGAVGGSYEEMMSRAPRYDSGGATYGRGGPLDDLNTIRVSPGEHMLDARDVSLMGGQAGVYAFRELLNSGKLGGPAADSGARAMVSAGAGRAGSAGSTLRDVTILTSDNPRAIVRALRADEQQQAALATAW